MKIPFLSYKHVNYDDLIPKRCYPVQTYLRSKSTPCWKTLWINWQTQELENVDGLPKFESGLPNEGNSMMILLMIQEHTPLRSEALVPAVCQCSYTPPLFSGVTQIWGQLSHCNGRHSPRGWPVHNSQDLSPIQCVLFVWWEYVTKCWNETPLSLHELVGTWPSKNPRCLKCAEKDSWISNNAFFCLL